MVSILGDIDVQFNNRDNVDFRKTVLSNNSYREGSSVENYFHNLNIYGQVMKIYVDFFTDYWYKDNVEKTNEKMIERLEEVGITGWSGFTEKDNNPLGEYVLSLDLPIKDSEMKEFFNRVKCGDLEFLCRYPHNYTNALELTRNVIGLY